MDKIRSSSVALGLSDFGRGVVSIHRFFLKEHVQATLVLCKWMSGHSAKQPQTRD